MLIIAIVLLLSSCMPRPTLMIDPELVVYVRRFEAALGKKTHFPIRFGTIDIGLAGQCTEYLDGVEIEISKSWWEGQNESAREEVVFHELGHCELGRGHDERVINGRPASVMYPTVFSTFYAKYRDEYVKELIDNRVYVRGLALPLHDNYDGDYQKR